MSTADARYKIHIDSLEIACRIGIHPFEREHPQRVRVSVTLWVERNQPGYEDRVSGIVNYERIVDSVRTMAAGEHTNLLETFADRVIDFAFDEPRVQGVRVRVEKPDIFDDVAAVGVEIERWREPADPEA